MIDPNVGLPSQVDLRSKRWLPPARLLGLVAILVLSAIAAIVATWPASPPPTRKPRLTIDRGSEPAAVAFSPVGRVLASGGLGLDVSPTNLGVKGAAPALRATVALRDVKTGEHLPGRSSGALVFEEWPVSSDVWPLAFTPDGATLLAGNWDRKGMMTGQPPPMLRAWDVATGKVKATLLLPACFGRRIAFADGGRTLLVSVGFGLAEERVLRWDVQTWQPLADVVLAAPRCNATALAPDGSAIAVVSFDRATITLYDLPAGRERATLSDPRRAGTLRSFVEILFAPDGRTLAVSCGDNTVQLWDARSATLRASVGTGLGNHVLKMTFAPDGRTLALGGSILVNDSLLDRVGRGVGAFTGLPSVRIDRVGRIQVVDVSTGRPIATFDGAQPLLEHLTFSPDGGTLATTGYRDWSNLPGFSPSAMTTMLWDIRPGP